MAGRTAMREPLGRWSLTQVAAEAGVTHRTARTIATAGYLDPDNLTYRDVITMRVAAALLDAPRPNGQTRTQSADTTTKRNFEGVRLARTVIDDPNPDRETRLAVLPHTARLATNAFALMGAIGEAGTDPVLILPIGEWVHRLRDTLHTPATTARTTREKAS